MRAALASLLLAVTLAAAASACTETPSDIPACVDPNVPCTIDAGSDAPDAGDAATAG
jgi:hypothetical protein